MLQNKTKHSVAVPMPADILDVNTTVIHFNEHKSYTAKYLDDSNRTSWLRILSAAHPDIHVNVFSKTIYFYRHQYYEGFTLLK